MEADTCPKCGAPAPALSELGVGCRVFDIDVQSLAALFGKKLDSVHCAAGCNLEVQPTVTVALTEPPAVYIVIGSQLEESRIEFLHNAEKMFREVGIIPQELPSLDALRFKVARRLAVYLSKMKRFFEALEQNNLTNWIRKHWRSLTPLEFAAARVALTGLVPGLVIAGRQGSSPSDILDQFATAQASVWLAMCMSWDEGDDHSPTLEDDLQEFIDQPNVNLIRRIFNPAVAGSV